jgi:hypothetical protein
MLYLLPPRASLLLCITFLTHCFILKTLPCLILCLSLLLPPVRTQLPTVPTSSARGSTSPSRRVFVRSYCGSFPQTTGGRQP